MEQLDLTFARTIQGKVVQTLLDSICSSGKPYSKKNLLFTTFTKSGQRKQTIEEQLMKLFTLFNQPSLKQAFQNIKRMATLNPSKKEAGIFRCFKDDQDNINTHPDTEQNVRQELDRISQRSVYQPLTHTNLPSIWNEEIQKLQKLMSKDKAITMDGISDNFIRIKTSGHFKDLWNDNTGQINQYIDQARVVPLNKVYQEIPSKQQFRPITKLSPFFKFLELRFLNKTQRF